MRDDLTPTEPLDADAGPRRSAPALVYVAVGGTIGTAARYLLDAAIPDLDLPDIGAIPAGILVINLTGAFLLGLLLEVLAAHGPDTGARRNVRLLCGTGILGGFTTYSALATDTALLLHDGHAAAALLYGLGTIIVGAACSVAGMALGRRLSRPGTARA